METSRDIEEQLKLHRVKLVPKAGSALMKVMGALLGLIGIRRFLENYWTTIARTIYYPSTVSDARAHVAALEHELVHVRQWERWNLLFWVSYLLLPLPFGVAWFRWRWEREAYLVQLRRARDPHAEVERIVAALWCGYGWPWPRTWMRRWFERQIRAWERSSDLP